MIGIVIKHPGTIDDIIAKAEEMCKRCRETGTDDSQLMVIRLDDLEELVELAKKGKVFTEMVNSWIKLTKEEKEKEQETVEEPEEAEDDIGEQV